MSSRVGTGCDIFPRLHGAAPKRKNCPSRVLFVSPPSKGAEKSQRASICTGDLAQQTLEILCKQRHDLEKCSDSIDVPKGQSASGEPWQIQEELPPNNQQHGRLVLCQDLAAPSPQTNGAWANGRCAKAEDDGASKAARLDELHSLLLPDTGVTDTKVASICAPARLTSKQSLSQFAAHLQMLPQPPVVANRRNMERHTGYCKSSMTATRRMSSRSQTAAFPAR